MANFATDGKLCIDRELDVANTDRQFEDIVTRFNIPETCKWITDNKYAKVNHE